jgi:hypothetical protein
MTYALAFLGSLCSVFLKGFQHKNVNANLYVHTFITSCAIDVMNVLLIGLIARSNWSIAIASGIGAAFGMTTAMYVHNRFVKKKDPT